ncbi:MAG TPA: winged helix-turn-helix domain-containing protein [Pyrinomonadaceae bacterium]|nr:winged helix-turn-helix domain-containing protein [Pyrinomonadaceae bacterium]
MSLEIKHFEFAEFYLDAEEKILMRHGQPVSVTPKAFQLLLVLIKNQGRPVKKSEIMKEVWAGSYVEDGNLTFTVNLLRKTLGDDRQNPRFIETIPKHGYRFIAEVKTVDENQSPGPLQNADSARRNYSFAVAALIFLFIGIIGLWFSLSKSQKAAADEKKSIAVLPLKPINAANRDEIYEIGVADSLIQRLSSIKGFVVRPLNAVRKYTEPEQDPLAAGREQKVKYVLASNYQTANGRIRITSQLLNVETGQLEETYKTEKDTKDVFVMQDAVAKEISDLLQKQTAVAGTSLTAAIRGTENEEAYRLYLQAMILVDKENLADSTRAIELFDEALTLDPNYAKAWAGKARAHCNYAHSGGTSPDEAFAKAKPAIERAFALDENLAEAHAVLGIIKSDYDRDFAEGEKQFRRAIELAPNSDIIYRWFANRLAGQGRTDEALTMVKTAIDLNPNYIAHQIYYGRTLYFARRYEEAISQLNRVIEIDSANVLALYFLWRCFQTKGDYEQAYQTFMKFQRLIGTKAEVLKKFETAYVKGGWQSVLLKNLEIIKTEDPNSSNAYNLALLSALVGEKEQSINYLGIALKNRSLEVSNIKGDPCFDSLRGDPRFEELVE